jgi:5'-3' exonuclease
MTTPVLIDANSLITRAIMATALDDLKAGGVLTGGIYGALNSITSIISMPEIELGPVYAFFDNGVPAFRKELFGEYKAKRKERRQLLSDEEKEAAFQQMQTTREILELLGVACLSLPDTEADDCVGVASRWFSGGGTPLVVSGDKDLWQCVSWGAEVLYVGNKGNRLLTAENFAENVAESFKCAPVSPYNYLLFKAMVGDASDCIPGAVGCGPKRAAEIMSSVSHDVPAKQLTAVVAALKAKTKRKVYEDSVIANEEWLKAVLTGIDISDSISPKNFATLLADMKKPREVMSRAFIRKCAKLQFNSVLGDPDRYLQPFKEATRGYERLFGGAGKAVAGDGAPVPGSPVRRTPRKSSKAGGTVEEESREVVGKRTPRVPRRPVHTTQG